MDINPGISEFEKVYAQGKSQVVWATMIADLDTPVTAFLKLSKSEPLSFLMESVEGGAQRGRYSFIGVRPDLVWRCKGDNAEINNNPGKNPDNFTPCPVSQKNGAVASLRALLKQSEIELPDTLPPMASGLIGYMAYDTVRLAENIPDNNPDVLGVPDGQFLRPTVSAIFDNVKDTVYIVTPVWPDKNVSAEQAFEAAQNRLADVVADFAAQQFKNSDDKVADVADLPEPVSNMKPEKFYQMVERAKEYILAGDIFQVVLSQRFSLPFSLNPFVFYRALRRVNPSPFMFFFDFGSFQIAGSSPEILVRVRDGKVTIRPIAGTRPRGETDAMDKELEQDLLGDPKELAEHLMLLDLGRNDVGRVAKIGTVKVTERNVVERYSHVMHIVSNVEGELDSEKFDAVDAMFAGFPAGTVSGAPKVRAMEIIDELEPERRGIYAGCIGYFGADGEMDSCIALRTAVIKDGTLYAQAGGGVVADSTPQGEFEESRNKARALIRSAEEAVKLSRKNN
ncbi:MAG: anthranilate synthase component I [Rhodospirillaceae bacterium]|nr:anthranilate synthase component I [Rhodospirillaceae bacterium]